MTNIQTHTHTRLVFITLVGFCAYQLFCCCSCCRLFVTLHFSYAYLQKQQQQHQTNHKTIKNESRANKLVALLPSLCCRRRCPTVLRFVVCVSVVVIVILVGCFKSKINTKKSLTTIFFSRARGLLPFSSVIRN